VVKQHVQKRLKTEQDYVDKAEEFAHLGDGDGPVVENSEGPGAI